MVFHIVVDAPDVSLGLSRSLDIPQLKLMGQLFHLQGFLPFLAGQEGFKNDEKGQHTAHGAQGIKQHVPQTNGVALS